MGKIFYLGPLSGNDNEKYFYSPYCLPYFNRTESKSERMAMLTIHHGMSLILLTINSMMVKRIKLPENPQQSRTYSVS